MRSRGRPLRSINPSWPKCVQTPPRCLRFFWSERMIVVLARRVSSSGWGALCERRRARSLGFRVGNPSAIGWHQRRIFHHPCTRRRYPNNEQRIATHSLRRKMARSQAERDRPTTGRQKPSPRRGFFYRVPERSFRVTIPAAARLQQASACSSRRCVIAVNHRAFPDRKAHDGSEMNQTESYPGFL